MSWTQSLDSRRNMNRILAVKLFGNMKLEEQGECRILYEGVFESSWARC
jgi:hypothetical protein